METKSLTAREEITAIAAANGWTAVEATETEKAIGIVEFKAPTGRRYVRIQFTVSGSVVEASTPRKVISGAGKRDRLVSILEAK